MKSIQLTRFGGAAGGVGSLLVQLAKAAAARTVIAAASTPEKLDFARGLGADLGVDDTDPGWVRKVRDATGETGVDLVYESTGGSMVRGSLGQGDPAAGGLSGRRSMREVRCAS